MNEVKNNSVYIEGIEYKNAGAFEWKDDIAVLGEPVDLLDGADMEYSVYLNTSIGPCVHVDTVKHYTEDTGRWYKLKETKQND